MEIDGKKILKELSGKAERRSKISFYLSRGLYTEFKEACGDVPAYKVLERLIEAFIASVKGGKKGR